MKTRTLFPLHEIESVSYTVKSYKHISVSARKNLDESGLSTIRTTFEEWYSNASSYALAYSTHGLHRYFGKFPPIVARHLITCYTREGETVLDPMVGSGTTAVEALLLGRRCIALDINPYSVLLTKVKSRRIPRDLAQTALSKVIAEVNRRPKSVKSNFSEWPKTIDIAHFFLPETCYWLQLLRESITKLENEACRELLWIVYASIIRKVSKVTTQQGRLFLDVKSSHPDPRPIFKSYAHKAIEKVATLPMAQDEQILCIQGSSLDFDFSVWSVPLIICHPPYFSGYRYSRILSLELAWLGEETSSIANAEIREFFKVGKPQNVSKYVEDMKISLERIAKAMRPNSVLALMIGDACLKGNRIQTTRLVLESVSSFLVPELIAVRTPKFTEASWVASQRRTSRKIGVALSDFVVVLRIKG